MYPLRVRGYTYYSHFFLKISGNSYKTSCKIHISVGENRLKWFRAFGEEKYSQAFFACAAKGSATFFAPAAKRVAHFQLNVAQTATRLRRVFALMSEFRTECCAGSTAQHLEGALDHAHVRSLIALRNWYLVRMSSTR